MATEFPSYLKLEHRPDGQAEASFLAEVDRITGSAERKFAEFSAEARSQVDAALSVQRNSAGSLDLGVAELRAAADAQEARAVAAREVAAATRIAAQEEEDYSQKARLAIAATEALAREEVEAAAAARSRAAAAEQVQEVLNRTASNTDKVVLANRRGTDAQRNVINSTRASRVAFIQLGQQMQDVTIQAQLGTNAFQIFAQQVPQAAFALSGLEQSANKVQARIGRFATFLSGPWGAAIFAATAVLGPFIASMIRSGDSAEDAADGIKSLKDEIDFAVISAEELAEVNQLLADANAEIERTAIGAANATRLKAEADREAAQAALQLALAEYERIAAFSSDPTFAEGNAAYAGQLRNLDDRISALRESVEGFGEQSNRATFNVELLTAGLDEQGRRAEELRTTINGLRQAYAATGDQRFLNEALQQQELLNQLNDRESRSRSGGRERTARLSDEERALQRATERADDYILSLQQQIEEIGLADDALRLLEVSRAADAAGTEDQARRIRELGDERERALELAEREANARAANDALNSFADDLGAQVTAQRLLLTGRETELRIIEEIARIEGDKLTLTQEQREEVAALVRAQEGQLEVLDRAFERQQAFLDATKDIRNELESFFAGEGADFERIARRLQSRLFVEEVFGDALRGIENTVQASFERSVDALETETDRAGVEVGLFADAVSDATLRITNASGGVPGAVGQDAKFDAFLRDFDAAFGAGGSVGTPSNDNEIVVSAKRDGTLNSISAEEYFDLVGKRLVEPLLAGLEDAIGIELAGELQGVLGGALGGYLGAGPVGGILGALKEIPGLDEALGGAVSGAFSGALQGAQFDAVLDSLGIKSSKTGATIGGAVGSLLGPIGSIVGSIAGGLLGGLIGGSDRGSAIISGGRVSGYYGDTEEFKQQSGQLAGSVLDAIDRIADSLGVSVNEAVGKVSIGIRDGNFVVDPQGRGYTKTSKFPDLQSFGQDGEAAVRAAILDLINDGVIAGLSAAEERLLKAGSDLDKALSDVLSFRGVFDRLRELKDPVGFALDQLNTEFEGLIDLFERAGASAQEFADLEELYGLERAQILQEASDRVSGALRQLLDDLNIGDNGLSLRDRRANAEASYDVLAARVQAGDVTAFDDFAQAARDLLDIERQLFGSQQEYFDRFDEVRNITQLALNEQERLAQEAESRDSPFGANGIDPSSAPIIASIDNGNQQIVDRLDALNRNVGQLILLSGGGGNAGIDLVGTRLAYY